jgi:hypothetical protein
MVADKGLAPEVADRIGTFVLKSGAPKDLWKELTDKASFGDHAGAGVVAVVEALFSNLHLVLVILFCERECVDSYHASASSLRL